MSILLENPRRRSKRRRSTRRRTSSRRRRRNPAPAVQNPRRRRRSRRRKSSRRRSHSRRRRNPFRLPGLGGGLMQAAGTAVAMTAGQYSAVILASAIEKIPGADKLPWNAKVAVAAIAGGFLVKKFGGPLRKHANIITASGLAQALYAVIPVGPYQIASKLGLGDYAIDQNYGARADSYGIAGTQLYGPQLGDWLTQQQLQPGY